MENTRAVGTKKEEIAARFLQDKGYFIIQKNYRVRQGEIDIVARDGSAIVFVEVKYRKSEKFGNPLEAVNPGKRRRICKTALFYLNQNKISVENTKIRFDVIGILGERVTHIENAFDFVDG